jgi:hypothetical protein
VNSPPRRARFQIHLSTAMVLMFVAGALIWANAVPRTINTLNSEFTKVYGWPCCSWGRYTRWGDDSPLQTFDYSLPLVALDIVVSVVLLFGVWFFCEWLIRRRAARKAS